MFVRSSDTVKKSNREKHIQIINFCVEFQYEDRHWEHIVRSSVHPEMLNNTQPY